MDFGNHFARAAAFAMRLFLRLVRRRCFRHTRIFSLSVIPKCHSGMVIASADARSHAMIGITMSSSAGVCSVAYSMNLCQDASVDVVM
tara:strand:+ start:379 stop:642 length:264 start_codon:yes stop_codon:yes gene_type:complete